MTDTNDARERWQHTLQALNTRKPDAKGATPLQHLAAMARHDTDPATAGPYILLTDSSVDPGPFLGLAEVIGTEVARRRWLAMYVDHLLDVAGAAADEAQRRYDQSDPDDSTGYESAFAEGAQFVLEALLHSLHTDPAGNRPMANANLVVTGAGGGGESAAATTVGTRRPTPREMLDEVTLGE